MKAKIYLIMTIALFTKLLYSADTRIIVTLRHPEVGISTKDLGKIEKLSKIKNKTPGKISKKMLKSSLKKYQLPRLGGFLALYFGYCDYSDSTGEISFPLRHEAEKLYLVVTPDIKLINVRGNTISHKEFIQGLQKKTRIYLFEKKTDKNKEKFWKVTQQKPPKHSRINPMSVVLLTNSNNIFVKTGDFMANDNKQMILPQNIFVLDRSDNTKLILNFLDKQMCYEQIKRKKEKIDKLTSKITIINS